MITLETIKELVEKQTETNFKIVDDFYCAFRPVKHDLEDLTPFDFDQIYIKPALDSLFREFALKCKLNLKDCVILVDELEDKRGKYFIIRILPLLISDTLFFKALTEEVK